MNPLRGIRRLASMIFRRDAFNILSWGRRTFDYGREVGDGTGSSTVAAPVLWFARNFPEAPPALWRKIGNGQEEQVDAHPLLKVLERPNAFYSGEVLWMATTTDYMVDGNAYWIVIRNAGGTPVQLWYAPSWSMAPKGSERAYISHYEYSVNGEVVKVDPANVIHFRHGIDAQDDRRGHSPLKSVLAEVFTDDEAARFTASLLRNMGVPGLLISPEPGVTLNEGDAEYTKDYVKEMFGGEKRGEPMVMSGATKVSQFGFSPEQLLLKDLRRIPEERVTAVLGIPAIVCGLGAGLDRSTFCLPADARVWTTSGPERIADVRAGRIVWSFEAGRLEPRRVTYAGCTGTKPLLEVRTKNRTVRATGNHPFLVRTPGSMTEGANHERRPGYEWRRADELRLGDHIVQAKALPDQQGETLPDGEPASAEFLQFLGAIVGDGTVSATGVRMAMPPSDRCVAAYQRLALGHFTKQVSQSGGGVAVQERVVRAPIVLQERERDFGFSSALEARRLTLLGFGGRAHTKRVPSWVWTLRREFRLSFLAGLVDTDGSIDKRGALTFTFCNRALTFDVRDLLVSVGIQASNVGRKSIDAARLPNPGRRQEYEAWTFTASSARQVAEIPFADPLYRERVEANASRHRSDGFDARKAGLADDLGFYEVKSIRELPAEPIYDLTVEGGHSFVADGCIVHNTNMGEAREAAYEAGIIPTQRILAAAVRFQLLPLFNEDPFKWRFGFDLSKVRVLQEDLYRQVQRMDLAIRGGWVQVSEGRRMVGLEVDEARDNVFLRPLNVATVPADGGQIIVPARSNGNGNGNGSAHEDAGTIAEEVIRALERRELTTGARR